MGFTDQVQAVLAGTVSYDSLDDEDQSIVRAVWKDRIEEARTSLDLAAEFTRAGLGWVEWDDTLGVVRRGPGT